MQGRFVSFGVSIIKVDNLRMICVLRGLDLHAIRQLEDNQSAIEGEIPFKLPSVF